MNDSPVTTVDDGARKVTRRVSVHASSADVFALVADPHRHPELDGSGTVRDVPVTGPERLSEGAKFSVGPPLNGLNPLGTEMESGSGCSGMGMLARWFRRSLNPSRASVAGMSSQTGTRSSASGCRVNRAGRTNTQRPASADNPAVTESAAQRPACLRRHGPEHTEPAGDGLRRVGLNCAHWFEHDDLCESHRQRR